MALELVARRQARRRHRAVAPRDRATSSRRSPRPPIEAGVQLRIVQRCDDEDDGPSTRSRRRAGRGRTMRARGGLRARRLRRRRRHELAVGPRRHGGERVDVLFVDEAGQLSLATVCSVARPRRSIVLLGDPQPAAAGLAGHPPRRRRGLGPRAPAGRRTDDRPGSRPVARDDVPPASGGQRLRLRRVLRGPPRTRGRERRPGPRGRPSRRRRRHPLRPVAARGRPEPLPRGGGVGRRRNRGASRAEVDGPEWAGAVSSTWPTSSSSRPTTPRSPRSPALPSSGSASAERRHRRQVPGPRGAGRDLLDDDVLARGCAARSRVPVLRQPPERRRLARPRPRRRRRLTRICCTSPAGRRSRCGWSTPSAGTSRCRRAGTGRRSGRRRRADLGVRAGSCSHSGL